MTAQCTGDCIGDQKFNTAQNKPPKACEVAFSYMRHHSIKHFEKVCFATPSSFCILLMMHSYNWSFQAFSCLWAGCHGELPYFSCLRNSPEESAREQSSHRQGTQTRQLQSEVCEAAFSCQSLDGRTQLNIFSSLFRTSNMAKAVFSSEAEKKFHELWSGTLRNLDKTMMSRAEKVALYDEEFELVCEGNKFYRGVH